MRPIWLYTGLTQLPMLQLIGPVMVRLRRHVYLCSFPKLRAVLQRAQEAYVAEIRWFAERESKILLILCAVFLRGMFASVLCLVFISMRMTLRVLPGRRVTYVIEKQGIVRHILSA